MDKNQFNQVIKRLPVHPDILAKEENYFNSAVLISLVYLSGEYHFLFEVRASRIRQENEVCFPGGRYEPELDTDYQDTAIRETVEELGISKGKIDVKGAFNTVVAPMGATVDTYVAELDIASIDELNIDKREVAAVFTAPLSYFKNNPPEKYHARIEIQPAYKGIDGNEEIYLPSRELGLPERYHTPWGGKKYNIYLYRYNDNIIWGITAQMVKEFVKLY